MDASTQLNAMMWYEKYSWTLMRGKEYRNMTNDQEVPALSLGYTTLKVRTSWSRCRAKTRGRP